jgi:hypothetical protein
MLSETAVFTRQLIPDAFSAIFDWSQGMRPALVANEQPSPPRVRRAGIDRTVMVASDPDVLRIENILTNILLQTEALLTQEEAVVVPEVFQLQPLTRRRVIVHITGVKAAAFQYVAEDEMTAEDDNR